MSFMDTRNFSPGVIWGHARIVTTTNGAISSTLSTWSGLGSAGVTRSAAGRYNFWLRERARVLVAVSAIVRLPGAPSSAALTLTRGSIAILRDDRVTTSPSPSFQLQFVRPDTAADADVDDGATIIVAWAVKMSGAGAPL